MRRRLSSRKSEGEKRPGKIRPLPDDDLRNPAHPIHEQQWLELAAALGRMAADEDWDRLHNRTMNGREDGKAKDGGHLQ